MKKTLMNPSADRRPLPKHYLEPKDILKLGYEESLAALADYDGPVRFLLESIIQCNVGHPAIPPTVAKNWDRKAKEIMNVIYKLNGLKQRWTEV